MLLNNNRKIPANAKSKNRGRKASSRPYPAVSRLFMLNKPFSVLTQFSGENGDVTLKNFFPIPDVYPAGRLDKDSEGLLLLTNDGRLQARIADPKFKQPKTYYVLVEGEPDKKALQLLAKGVELKDGFTSPAEVELVAEPDWLWPRNPQVRVRKHIKDSWLRLTIREGRNRQVRRMTAAVGHPTLRLVRYQIGSLSLDGLAPGSWREVEPDAFTSVAPNLKK